MASAAELRQILKEDSSGKNLYDHLTETLMKVLLDRPSNAFDNFELISAEVKANPLNPDPELGRPVPPSAEEVANLLKSEFYDFHDSLFRRLRSRTSMSRGVLLCSRFLKSRLKIVVSSFLT